MAPDDYQSKHRTEKGLRFATTCWTDLAAARRAGSTADSAAALERLCAAYWFPIYTFLRRRGCDPHEAQDFTQEFFCRLVSSDLLGRIDRRKGRFRSFLLVVVRRFLSGERDRERAIKRGGAQTFLSFDVGDAENRYAAETMSDASPDKAYEQAWFRTLLDRVLDRLRDEQAAAGKEALFDRLRVFLDDDSSLGAYQALAAELSTKPNAVAVAVFRLKQRYQELASEEIARTVSDPADIEPELRHLLEIFGT